MPPDSAFTYGLINNAAMSLWRGQNEATGMENRAQGLRYSGQVAEAAGEEEKRASRMAALATIAGGGASMLKTYGAYKYPTGSGGVRLS